MPIQFKAVQRPEPGVLGGGIRKWYASPVMGGEVSIEDLTRSIEKISTISGADIRGSLYAFVDVAIEHLAHGRIVRLGDLGSLRITLSSNGEELGDDLDSADIKKAGVIFTPGSRIKETLKLATYQKVV